MQPTLAPRTVENESRFQLRMMKFHPALLVMMLTLSVPAAEFTSTGVSGNWTNAAVWRSYGTPAATNSFPDVGVRGIINGAGVSDGQTLTISVTTSNQHFGEPSNFISASVWAHGTALHPINVNVATNCTLTFDKNAYMMWTTASYGGVDGPGRLVNNGQWEQGTAGFMRGVQGTFENQGRYLFQSPSSNSMVLNGRALFSNGTNGSFELNQFSGAGPYSLSLSSNGVFRNEGTIRLNNRTLEFGVGTNWGAVLQLSNSSRIVSSRVSNTDYGKLLYNRDYLMLTGMVVMDFSALYTPQAGDSYTVIETTGLLAGTVQVTNTGWEANIVGNRRLVISRIADSTKPNFTSEIIWQGQPQYYWKSGGKSNGHYALYYLTNVNDSNWLAVPGATNLTNRAWAGPYPDAPKMFFRVGLLP